MTGILSGIIDVLHISFVFTLCCLYLPSFPFVLLLPILVRKEEVNNYGYGKKWYQPARADGLQYYKLDTPTVDPKLVILPKQLNDTNLRVKGEEDQKASINAQSSKVKADADKLRGEIKTLEASMEATEEDKLTKDSQIRTLKEEIIP